MGSLKAKKEKENLNLPEHIELDIYYMTWWRERG